MLKKIIACFVMLTFFIIIVAPNVDAGRGSENSSTANKSDWNDFGNEAGNAVIILGAIVVVALVASLIIWSVRTMKKKSTGDKIAVTPKEDISSLPTIEKDDLPTINETENASVTAPQKAPIAIEISDAGVVVLKW